MTARNMPGRRVRRAILPENLRKHAFVTGEPGSDRSVFIFDVLRRLAIRLGLPSFPLNKEPRNGKSETI